MLFNQYGHAGTCAVCPYLVGIYASYAGQAASEPQSLRKSSLPPKVWQWIRESTATTTTMPGAAEVMPEVDCMPLLQRQSASEARRHGRCRHHAKVSF